MTLERAAPGNVAGYEQPKMLIGGEWVLEGLGPDIVDPATLTVLGRCPRATEAEVDRAIDSAAKGFRIWSTMSVGKRSEILLEAARLMRERRDEIARIATLEEGKPFEDAKAELTRAASILEWDVNEGRRAYGRVIPGDPAFQQFVIRQPIGPVAGFTAWNGPIGIPTRKLAGALAAGCSIVLKAAQETPGSATALVKCYVDAGVPAHVINLIFGDSTMISDRLLNSPVIRLIAFTGSTQIGKKLAAMAGQQMKRVVMELGGHAPTIICDDVDVEKVAALAAKGKFRNAGQICVSPTRFIVQRGCYDRFLEAFVAKASAMKVGPGLEAGTEMGPLANARRLSAVDALIRDAVDKGATLATGGKRIDRPGHFYEPTVLSHVPANAAMMQEEPFGPVAPLVSFETLDEAIEIANNTSFGLASYAFTSDTGRAHQLIRDVACGTLSINHFGASLPETPFGGIGESGIGREGGSETLDAYLETRFISMKGTL